LDMEWYEMSKDPGEGWDGMGWDGDN
jgi:hypothetical protein